MPHPLGAGGCVHEFELIRALTRDHDVHVVGCHFDSALGPEPMLETGARYTPVQWTKRSYPTSKVGVARGMIRAHPSLVVWLGRDRIAQLSDAISTIVARESPDLLQVTHGELAELLGRVRLPTALLLFDAMTRAALTRLEVEPLLRRRAQLRVEAARTKRFERRWYRNATGVASVSSVDAAWFEALLDRPVEVLENPVGDEFFAPATVARSTDRVTFVGALTFAPNADAIRWLVRDIWPLVRARRPDAKLHVVGRGDNDPAVDDTRAAVEAVGGVLSADVADIRPYYWGAAAVVAPVRHGAGLRNKVLHAMACRAPVIASPAALEGVPATSARNARCAATAHEFADAIVAVLDDPVAASVQAEEARAGLDPLRIEHIAARHEHWWAELCR